MTDSDKNGAPTTDGPVAVPSEPPVTSPTAHVEAPMHGAGAGADSIGGKPQFKEQLKGEAEKLGGQAAEKARGFAAEGKDKATGALDEFAKMMTDAAGTVDDKLGDQYGQYARSAAGAVSGFADTLRGKEVDDLLEDVRGFVKKSPVMAIGAAAAIGFVLARIVKSGFDGDDA